MKLRSKTKGMKKVNLITVRVSNFGELESVKSYCKKNNLKMMEIRSSFDIQISVGFVTDKVIDITEDLHYMVKIISYPAL